MAAIPSIESALSLQQIKTFSFVESRPQSLNRTEFPRLFPDRLKAPIQVELLRLEGHPSSLFKSAAHIKIPSLDALQCALVRAFNPKHLLLGMSKGGQPSLVNIHRHLQDPEQPGWNRLAHITLKSVTLRPPISARSFGGSVHDSSFPPWSVVFDVGPQYKHLPWSTQPTWLRGVLDFLQLKETASDYSEQPCVTVMCDSPWDRFRAVHLVESWMLARYGPVTSVERLRDISFAAKARFVVTLPSSKLGLVPSLTLFPWACVSQSQGTHGRRPNRDARSLSI